MKISIFSFATNDKFPIDIQYRQFKKFLKDEFEFILFNDAFTPSMQQAIETIVTYNQIDHVNVPQHIHRVQNPSEGYAATLNWAVKDFAINRGCEIILLVHADVFPTQPLSVIDILGKNFVASTVEYRKIDGKEIYYLYPALTAINMKNVGNLISTLDFSVARGLDTGGMTFNFVEKNNSLVRRLNNLASDGMARLSSGELKEYLEADLQICSQYKLNKGWFCEGFYHYMAGSQWNSSNPAMINGHSERMKLFLKYFY
jgi:hypothetical protein